VFANRSLKFGNLETSAIAIVQLAYMKMLTDGVIGKDGALNGAAAATQFSLALNDGA